MGMAVLNLKNAHVMIYASFDKSFIILNVCLDMEYATDLLSKATKNYFNHMLHYLCLNTSYANENNNSNIVDDDEYEDVEIEESFQ